MRRAMLCLFGGRYSLNGRLPNGCARARAERRRQRRREGRAFNAHPPAAWSSRALLYSCGLFGTLVSRLVREPINWQLIGCEILVTVTTVRKDFSNR